MDWGLAKHLGEEETGSHSLADNEPVRASTEQLTMPGRVPLTPAYASPEQVEGDLEAIGPRSDVYSIGATLYHLLTGAPPIVRNGEEPNAAMLERIVRGDWSDANAANRNIPRTLVAITSKALQTVPHERYQTAAALAADINSFLADEPELCNERVLCGTRVRLRAPLPRASCRSVCCIRAFGN